MGKYAKLGITSIVTVDREISRISRIEQVGDREVGFFGLYMGHRVKSCVFRSIHLRVTIVLILVFKYQHCRELVLGSKRCCVRRANVVVRVVGCDFGRYESKQQKLIGGKTCCRVGQSFECVSMVASVVDSADL